MPEHTPHPEDDDLRHLITQRRSLLPWQIALLILAALLVIRLLAWIVGEPWRSWIG